MTVVRAVLIILIASTSLAGCGGGSDEQAQALCSSLDADRQTDPLVLAHRAYGYDPYAGGDPVEALNAEVDGIQETCLQRHSEVARYLAELAAFNASVDSPPMPPSGYGGR